MRHKAVLWTALALLAGVAFCGLQASARCSPSIRECRAEASYTTMSLSSALGDDFYMFDVSFELALRDNDGQDLGWVFTRTAPTSPGSFIPGFNAAAKIHSVEFHGDIAIFVGVWQRGTSGTLGQAFFGLASNPAGTASVIGMRDGSQQSSTDRLSEHFFFLPSQVPANPNDLLDTQALDDTGNPFPGFEGWTVRDYILQQLQNQGGFPIHPGGDINICTGP